LKLEGVKSCLNVNPLLRKLIYVESCPVTCQAATEGRKTCNSTCTRPRCKKGPGGQCHARLLYPQERLSSCCTGDWMGVGLMWMGPVGLALSRFNTQTISPILHHNTDYAASAVSKRTFNRY
jgi:hypothetical protein